MSKLLESVKMLMEKLTVPVAFKDLKNAAMVASFCEMPSKDSFYLPEILSLLGSALQLGVMCQEPWGRM